ncbi:MAG: ArnT family glycosyltransferase [Hyphomonas sp.]
MPTVESPRQSHYTRITFIALLGLLFLRVFFLVASPLNLYADEAQYWRWGETLDWGYYSKPPMIAWVIHSVTALFGNQEWGVRLAAPFLHTFTASLLFLLGRSMYGDRVGMFAALGYALMPAVTLSSAVISTDGVLLPFWTLSLYCFWRLRSGEGQWVSAALLGLGLGAGFLSKYAMIYFPIGIGLALVIDKDSRRALFSFKGLLAACVGLAIFAPHIFWNAAHDFKTVSHTVDNANLGGDLINPGNALSFLVDQMGVFGPISFLALFVGIFIMRSKDLSIMGRDRWLLCFILPVLIIILFQAVLSRANANWAATAYPAASVLVAAWLTRAQPNRVLWLIIAALTLVALLLAPDVSLAVRFGAGACISGAILGISYAFKQRPSGLLWINLGVHSVLLAFFITTAMLPQGTTTKLGLDNAMKRTRGWEQTTQRVFTNAEDIDATAILVDEREVWHALDYYARDRETELLSWRRYGVPKSFSESAPVTDANDDRVLVASLHPANRARIRSDFETMEDLGEVQIFLGKRSNGCPILRTLHLYAASGYTPQPRSPEWEAAFEDQKEFPNPPCPKPKPVG